MEILDFKTYANSCPAASGITNPPANRFENCHRTLFYGISLNRLSGGYFFHVIVSKELREGAYFLDNLVQEFTSEGYCDMLSCHVGNIAA